MFFEQLRSLNYLAILVAGLAAFLLGGVWYTALFGNAWKRLSGYTDEQMQAMRSVRPMPVFFGIMIACYVIAAFAIAIILRALAVTTPGAGAMVGLIVFIVVGAFAMTGHISSPRPLKLYLIDAGFALVFLPVIGSILAIWR